jgi:hypothetical protein
MSRTTGRCVGAAVAALPVDLEQHGRSDEAESRRPLVTAEARNAHFGEAGDAIAYLDALAAQMRACGWTAYINPPARRFASLFVQDPHNRAVWADIIAAPDSSADDWWYWFSWAERITAVHVPAVAADAIIATLRLPPDGPQSLPAAASRMPEFSLAPSAGVP